MATSITMATLLVGLTFLGLASCFDFEQIMAVPLRQCAVVLYSHEIVEEDGHKFLASDQRLVEEAIQGLVKMEIPLQFWIRRPSGPDRSEIYKGLFKNRKLTCTTSLWFLKTRIFSTIKTQSVELIPYLSSGNRIERTENDFTILGVEDIPGYTLRVNMTFPIVASARLPTSSIVPGNLILVRMRPHSTKGDTEFYVDSVGGLRYYCSSSRYFCVDWLQATDKSIQFWQTSHEFHRQLGQLSSYLSGRSYNFNKARLTIKTDDGRVRFKHWKAIRKLGYRKGLFPSLDTESNRRLYGKSMPSNIIQLGKYVDIFESIFNATMNAETLSEARRNLNEAIRWPSVVLDGINVNDLDTSTRTVHHGFTRETFYCVDFQLIRVKFYALLHPMDAWTWICLASSAGALSLTFWKYTKTPVLSLLSLFFAQANAGYAKKFKLLLVLWSCLGLLLTAGYSSLIASLLIVPPATSHPKNFKQVYEQGYKFLSRGSDDVFKISGNFRKDVLKDPVFKEKIAHFFKINEERIKIPKFLETGRPLVPYYMGKYGKYCQGGTAVGGPCNGFEILCSGLLEEYDDIICFTSTEELSIGQVVFMFCRTNAEVLRRGVQTLFAVGIMDFFEKYQDLATLISINLSPWLISARSSEYRFGYFFRTIRDKEPCLFTLRNAQGRMIFYFGLICATVSLCGLVVEFGASRGKIWYAKGKNQVVMAITKIRELSGMK